VRATTRTLPRRIAPRAAERIAVLYQEYRFLAAVVRCRVCGQHFLQIFAELSSWDGDDSQSNQYIPITPAKAKQLRAAKVDEGYLDAMKLNQRHLSWIHARGSEDDSLSWVNGAVTFLPHD
jgi:hypothetical protein